MKSEARVGIDGRALISGPAGIATYVRNLLEQLPQLDPVTDPSPGNNLLWNLLRVPYCQLKRRWLLYHGPGYTAPPVSFTPVLLSVHDVSYFVQEEWYPNRLDFLRRSFFRRSIQKADRILVPSRFSASEVERIFPGLKSRIRTTPLAAGAGFYSSPPDAEAVRKRFNLPESFLLHVGDIHLRRNVGLLQETARSVGMRLVLVGRKLDERVKIGPDVIHLSGIPLEDLRGLYSAASIFVYASIYEGFGLPILEAMACGLPVVAVNRASVPEVCGEAGILVEPVLVELEKGIEKALRQREALVSRGFARASEFSWSRTAEATLRAYNETALARYGRTVG